MQVHLSYDCQNIDWNALMALLKHADMGTYTPELHRRAFENSYRAVFLFDGDRLIGCGRLLCDGAYQGAIYDVAVDGQYRGCGLGRKIMNELLRGAEGMNILLYASPGKESFYEKFGFSAAKTGMVRFQNPSAMMERGFI